MASDKNLSPDELRQLLQSKLGSNLRLELFPKTKSEDPDPPADEKVNREKAFEFEYLPSQIKEELDRFVVQQIDAKKVLATAICDHYHHIQSCHTQEDCRDYKKQNIILIGPTGVGKTYLIQNIAHLIGVPFVKADATKYSETGYVGGDVEDLVRELVQQAGGDVELAQYGIVYIDEVDKIASTGNSLGKDVSGHGVQRGLLKLMEETEVSLRAASDVAGQMQAFIELQAKGKVERKTISTKHILFIVSGAFTGLLEIIRKRLGSKQIGFTGPKRESEQEHFLFGEVSSNDFIDYGFEAEFVGRLPVVVHCNPLSVDDLFMILRYSEGSLLRQYKQDFLAYGIDIYFTDEGMRALAELAAAEGTGARGLMTVCERTLRNYKYVLPDREEIRELVVTTELVNNPDEELELLLANPDRFHSRVAGFQIKKLEGEFEEIYGFPISFTDDAVNRILEKAGRQEQSPSDFCRQLFKGYEHGLILLKNAPPRSAAFRVDAQGIDNPGQVLEEWIRDTYQ